MCGKWVQRTFLGVLVGFAAGCWTTQPQLKPPTRPEEFMVPPESEARFSSPPTYPKENQREPGPKKTMSEPGGAMPRFGGGARGY